MVVVTGRVEIVALAPYSPNYKVCSDPRVEPA